MKRQKKRFGFVVDKDRYKMSNMARIVSIVLAIIVIPLQIFLKSVLEETENGYLISLQNQFRDNKGLQTFLLWVLMVADVNFTLFSGMMLFLVSDSLIAFKSSMVYCFGLYIIVILKLFYESPRPFWNSTDIDTF